MKNKKKKIDYFTVGDLMTLLKSLNPNSPIVISDERKLDVSDDVYRYATKDDFKPAEPTKYADLLYEEFSIETSHVRIRLKV